MESKPTYFPLVLFICFKKSFLFLNLHGRNPIVDHSNKNIEQEILRGTIQNQCEVRCQSESKDEVTKYDCSNDSLCAVLSRGFVKRLVLYKMDCFQFEDWRN